MKAYKEYIYNLKNNNMVKIFAGESFTFTVKLKDDDGNIIPLSEYLDCVIKLVQAPTRKVVGRWALLPRAEHGLIQTKDEGELVVYVDTDIVTNKSIYDLTIQIESHFLVDGYVDDTMVVINQIPFAEVSRSSI